MNAQQTLDATLASLPRDVRPTLLLHACCAPCSSYVLEYLAKHFRITLFFYNPNIAPLQEYQKRLIENKELCEQLKVEFIELEYNNEHWCELTKGLEHLPERGERCSICFGMRLRRTFEYAKEHNFNAVASVLGVSRYKDLNQVNRIAHLESSKAGIPYIEIEGRKNGMQELRLKLIKEFNLYNQDYCGCKPREDKNVLE